MQNEGCGKRSLEGRENKKNLKGNDKKGRKQILPFSFSVPWERRASVDKPRSIERRENPDSSPQGERPSAGGGEEPGGPAWKVGCQASDPAACRP